MQHHHVWDAGDLGCGELIFELRMKIGELSPGQVLLLTARDSGSPEEIPAWCSMTGNPLVGAEHPRYWIRRKE